MQTRDLRLEFGSRREMMGEVVDENGVEVGTTESLAYGGGE